MELFKEVLTILGIFIVVLFALIFGVVFLIDFFLRNKKEKKVTSNSGNEKHNIEKKQCPPKAWWERVWWIFPIATAVILIVLSKVGFIN